MLDKGTLRGENYFFNKVQTQLLRKQLKFIGYPTYMIIDKAGKLVNKNAPAPSSGDRIRKVLNEWIEK
jgi:hypothetical protein